MIQKEAKFFQLESSGSFSNDWQTWRNRDALDFKPDKDEHNL